MAHDVRLCLVAQEQGKRVDQNRLPCPGLAGKQVQSRTELHGNVIDDGVILDTKFDEHQAKNSVIREGKQSVSPRRHGATEKISKNILLLLFSVFCVSVVKKIGSEYMYSRGSDPPR